MAERREKTRETEKKKNWYAKDGSEAVLFVEATPDGSLAEECRKTFKENGFKVKVIERSGCTVKNALTKSNPFKKNGCNDTTCEVCALGLQSTMHWYIVYRRNLTKRPRKVLRTLA